jgi:hypothetical protein
MLDAERIHPSSPLPRAPPRLASLLPIRRKDSGEIAPALMEIRGTESPGNFPNEAVRS